MHMHMHACSLAPNTCITFVTAVTTLINHISITTMSTLMKVGAIDRAPGAQLIAPTFMSPDMVVIEIWLIKVVTPSQKWCTYWERDC